MEHEDAMRTSAAERYLLGQMGGDERAIFEEHYFDCRICAEAITEGTRLMVVGRVVAKESPQSADVLPFRRWSEWAPAAAAASLVFGLLGTGIGYRIARVEQRPATELVQPIQMVTGVSRAGTVEQVPYVVSGDELRLDIEPREDAVRYDAVIACGGKTQWRNGISREMAANAVTVRLGELPAGRCALVIEGVREDGNRFEITRSPFEVGGREGVR